MDAAITIRDLSKAFGELHAVDGLSLDVERGEMFALVGPDGAGKTTTIRMLCGILHPDAGSIAVMGLDVAREIAEVRRHLGYLSQRFTLYGDLSIDENIEFFARIHGVRDFRARRDELLEFTRLTEFRARLADRLSGGMKQKLALACTLIHTPDLILLDEPTTGVDPVTRRDFWKLLADLMKRGTTILLTTPYLDEAERCTRVAMMSHGRILACAPPDDLRAASGKTVVEIVCSPVRKALAIIREDPRLRAAFPEVQMLGERLDLFRIGDVDEAVELLRAVLGEHNVSIASIRTKRPSLENIFLELLEHESAEAEADHE
jgi:ABC-2 type transport system ATP-binding protein